eukprot:NODE_6009_length_939_cov_27.422794_g5421_i0.p1 GENE.NODE_6009_length_939_cov_27.422794_g5421_i0~~NODE_6009_length_939_cov_27.422794_g5421_i0.p1  ORF type:complete len:139 (-),score=40.91 NODE_6009_length_939_cov_27.422794_g5421_i0:37-453(-)
MVKELEEKALNKSNKEKQRQDREVILQEERALAEDLQRRNRIKQSKEQTIKELGKQVEEKKKLLEREKEERLAEGINLARAVQQAELDVLQRKYLRRYMEKANTHDLEWQIQHKPAQFGVGMTRTEESMNSELLRAVH